MTQTLNEQIERMDAQAIETLVTILGYPLPIKGFLEYLQQMDPDPSVTLEEVALAYREHVRSKSGR